MIYKSLESAAIDLEQNGQLLRIPIEVDPDLEMAEIHRRVFEAGGPALLFEKVKGSPFRALSNLYGTFERTEWLFRHTLEKVQKVIQLKADPTAALRAPLHYASAPLTALTALPRKQRFRVPVAYGQTTVSQLPQIKSWPMDGGAFVTMPQVLSLPPGSKNIMQSNLGMYRIQLSGNAYLPDREIGMHYQLHRGIGVHHTQYNSSNDPFRVSIFVGGPPSHAFSAIMPLPEGLSELTFAGLLGGRRFRYAWDDQGHVLSADADFVITGRIVKDLKKPEGPFGDHLGYYSLTHDFPVMEVDRVYHRKNAIWHFSVVGRPPMEDSSFGHLIHLLVKPLTPQEFPGVREIRAVDESGVHPLLLAIGSERYMPFREPKPEEILTQANRILGSGQTSLAKYLFIASGNDHPTLSTRNLEDYFQHILERVDWRRDLHFHTQTTIDTLDYSGSGWNAGSKVVIAACGPQRRSLGTGRLPTWQLPVGVGPMAVAIPGVLLLQVPQWQNPESAAGEIAQWIELLGQADLESWPLILLVDDARFCAAHWSNWVWVAFTRSNPSHDIYGIGAQVVHKHWGCTGSLIIDARIKSHHAPELVPDRKVTQKVDSLFAKGGALHGLVKGL